MHDSLSQMHPYGNRPDREVLQILHLSCRLSAHVPVRSSGTGRFVYGLPDEVSHIYLSYMSPEIPLHKLPHINADMRIRLNLPDKPPDQ